MQVSDPLSQTKKSNQINGLTPLTKKPNDFKHLASEAQMTHSEVDLLQWESLVRGIEGNEPSETSVVTCSSVVDSVVTPPSDHPSEQCSSVVTSEVP